MLRELSQKIRIEANNKFKTYCRKAFCCSRLAYNWGLAEYKKELIKATEKYNEMTDFFLMNRPDDNTPTEYDDFTPSDIDKELSYRLFMVQEEVKDYAKSYAKTECELFVEAHKRYMNCD